jgi:hypothetical protein
VCDLERVSSASFFTRGWWKDVEVGGGGRGQSGGNGGTEK